MKFLVLIYDFENEIWYARPSHFGNTTRGIIYVFSSDDITMMSFTLAMATLNRNEVELITSFGGQGRHTTGN